MNDGEAESRPEPHSADSVRDYEQENMKFMLNYDLSGPWQVRKADDTETFPATVPGCIHTDLLAAGKIDDPYYRDNEARQMWIGETDWLYSRTFSVSPELLDHEVVLLRCEGLDTLSRIALNGQELGRTNNQFRTWEFDVKSWLRPGDNTLEVLFESTIPYIQDKQRQHYLKLTGQGPDVFHGWHRVDGSNYIRKSQCNYGWDWGPMCVTAGIWRPIKLIAFNTVRLTDVLIRQDHSQTGQVILNMIAQVERTSAGQNNGLHAQIRVLDGQECVCQTTVGVNGTRIETSVTVTNPKLWWPNGLGAQPLYDVQVELCEQTTVLDTCTKRIGLRSLVLDRHPDQWGESFQFVVNGVPFFAKGANWIPADTFVTRITRAQYDDLLKSAADAHMNMLRVWGGGIYEDDAFYDLCDQYGLCIWHDLMFACSAYPAFDEAYVENVKVEIAQNVQRLRHHPSLALWCGNNELEHIHQMFLSDTPEHGKMTWEEYLHMFDDVIPTVVRQHDPERAYWPSSSHSPVGDRKDPNNPACGDAHLWEVWHGRQPFEWYRTCEHRFNSEFGFQSFPEPAIVNTYTLPEDRNITSYIMEYHQRSGIGNDAIIQYMLSWFKLPTSFEMLLWLSQILQGIGMKYAVEHWRRSQPRGMGTLYWQINDCWPGPTWSSIDYFGNWKALHYMAREFFAPVLVSAIEDSDQGTAEVHITSDLQTATTGVLIWTLTDTTGTPLASNRLDCKIPAQADHKVMLLNVADHLAAHGKRQLLLWLELTIDNSVVSQNLVTFVRPKHLELQEPGITTTIRPQANGAFAVTLTAAHPALWVWPELQGIPARYSQRFFHLRPGQPKELVITPPQPVTLTHVESALVVRSLFDTWNTKNA